MDIHGDVTAVRLVGNGSSVRSSVKSSEGSPVPSEPSTSEVKAAESSVKDTAPVVRFEQVAEEQTKKSEDSKKESAAKLAKQLEKALNDAFGTKVRFNVASQADSGDAFSFQIIEKESGEVLREFPEDTVRSLVSREDLELGQGVFFDTAA